MVAEKWSGEPLLLLNPSPVACLSAGYLLPRLSYPHVELKHQLYDQHVVLFTRGLGNSCVDHHQPRSGLSITIRSLVLRSRDGLQATAQLLSSPFSISHLVLRFDLLSLDPQVVLRCISEAMATNTSVRSLELEDLFLVHSDSPPGDCPGPALHEMLERNKTLDILSFRTCSIAQCVASIAEGLVHNTTLKEIVLNRYGTDFTDTGLKSLADMLMNNTTLETLEIVKSYISIEGDSQLPEALKWNSTLHVLRLGESDMCSNPEPLAVALTVNTTLERLELDEPDETDAVDLISVPSYLTDELMSNGVLQQLLTIVTNRTVSEFGGEETGRALMTILDEWESYWDWRGYSDDSSCDIFEWEMLRQQYFDD